MEDETRVPAVDGGGQQGAAEAMTAAEQGLADVQAMLQGAARGEVQPDRLRASLQEYLETHGPAIQATMETVGEGVRQQALSQLYAWRAQLRAQTAARAGEERHYPEERHNPVEPADNPPDTGS